MYCQLVCPARDIPRSLRCRSVSVHAGITNNIARFEFTCVFSLLGVQSDAKDTRNHISTRDLFTSTTNYHLTCMHRSSSHISHRRHIGRSIDHHRSSIVIDGGRARRCTARASARRRRLGQIRTHVSSSMSFVCCVLWTRFVFICD
jgi:hypothetical protein